MRPLSSPRRDPAPSRWAYRMQRLWLTPLFRVFMRVGVPVFVVTFSALFYLSDDSRRGALVKNFSDLRESFEQRPEFRVTLMQIDGASQSLADAVRQTAAVKLPQSSFDIDLDAARMRIETLDAIAGAELMVKSGGILQVVVTERVPAVLWRTEKGIDLLDATGRRVAMVPTRADRADLPLLSGEGANKAVPEALALMAAAGPLIPRLRGLVRVSERRWDLVLDRDQRIMLPAENALIALQKAISLQTAQDILARDVLAVDLRNNARPVLRLAPYALKEIRRAKGLETVENDL